MWRWWSCWRSMVDWAGLTSSGAGAGPRVREGSVRALEGPWALGGWIFQVGRAGLLWAWAGPRVDDGTERVETE